MAARAEKMAPAVVAADASPPRKPKKRQLDALCGPIGDAAAPGGAPRGRGQKGGGEEVNGGGERKGLPGRRKGREPKLEPLEDSVGPDDSGTPLAELAGSKREDDNTENKAGAAVGGDSSDDEEEAEEGKGGAGNRKRRIDAVVSQDEGARSEKRAGFCSQSGGSEAPKDQLKSKSDGAAHGAGVAEAMPAQGGEEGKRDRKEGEEGEREQKEAREGEEEEREMEAGAEPRMVTRKKDISHATAAVRFSPLAPTASSGKEVGGGSGKKGAEGRGADHNHNANGEVKEGPGGGGNANAKKSKKKGGGGGGKSRKGRKGRGVNQDLMPDWLLNPGALGRDAAAKGEPTNRDEEYVRMTVAPRAFEVEDAQGKPVVLSKVHKGSSIQLSEDQLSATSWKGYRMVRATRGVQDGAWYFEIRVMHLGSSGHVRLGWATSRADVQAPVGFDSHGYGYRDVDGAKVSEALRRPYAEPYKEGDVIGCYISLPGGGELAPKPRKVAVYRGQNFYVEELQTPGAGEKEAEKAPAVVKGSEVVFYKNGVCQGTAFQDLVAEQYYPAVSLYTLPEQTEGATVTFNFGPDFEFLPGKDAWGQGADGEPRAPGVPVQMARAVGAHEDEFDPAELKSPTTSLQSRAQERATAAQGPVTAGEHDTVTGREAGQETAAGQEQDSVTGAKATATQGTDAVTADSGVTAQGGTDAVTADGTVTAQGGTDTVTADDTVTAQGGTDTVTADSTVTAQGGSGVTNAAQPSAPAGAKVRAQNWTQDTTATQETDLLQEASTATIQDRVTVGGATVNTVTASL